MEWWSEPVLYQGTLHGDVLGELLLHIILPKMSILLWDKPPALSGIPIPWQVGALGGCAFLCGKRRKEELCRSWGRCPVPVLEAPPQLAAGVLL